MDYKELFDNELNIFETITSIKPTDVIVNKNVYKGLMISIGMYFGYKLEIYKGIKVHVGEGTNLLYFYKE